MRVKNNQRGFTLIEILISLALLAIIGVAFLAGLSTTSKAVTVSEDKVAAESLAKSQMEHIKTQDYISVADYDPGDPAQRYEAVDIPANLVSAGYDVEISPPEIVTAAGRAGFELQSVTIKVKRNNSVKLVITFYRTGLAL